MKARGFTLLELLIVLAIIGILASIIIPAVRGHFSGGVSYGPTSGTAVHRVDGNTPQCVNGVLLKNGDPIVVNGAAVKC